MLPKVCRLCLAETQQLLNIFNHNIKELPEIVCRCSGIEILEHDELPKSVCVKCMDILTQFDSFRKQCQYSNDILKERYSKDNKRTSYSKIAPNQKFSNNTKDCVELFNVNETLNKRSIESIKRTRIKKLQNKLQKTEYVTDITDNRYNSSNNILNNSDSNSNYSDSDCNVRNEANSTTNIPLRSKKYRIKRISHKSRGEKHSIRHHLVYTEQDYAILGRERKVRIYEIDDTIKEIIGHNVYNCDICTAEFESFFQYYDHQETHNGQYVFKCSKCKEIFSKRQDLVEHDARHKIPCQICEQEVLPKSMSAHLLIHTDIHKCPDCGMRHTSNASLEKHIKARHTGIKGFVCHVCGKQSSCQSSMNRHVAYHSSERPYKCKYCDFCAKSLNIVQVHTSRKHFAEKCVCEICAKLFKSQPSLIQHMKRIHTPRKHVCDICGKAFIERYNLNRHLKKHAGQRLHECKICHKEFFTVRKLKEHMHSHRQGCVNCPKCGKEFFYKKYYTNHVLKCTKANDSTIAINNSECVIQISNFKQIDGTV